MLRLIILFALLFSANAYAADPSQFSSLLTDSTDYTCGGTTPCETWELPSKPPESGTYTDPVFGTTTKRIPAPTDCVVDGGHPLACSTRNFYPDYSKQMAWNSDGSKYLIKDDMAWYYLYDSSTDLPIRRITDASGLAGDDVKWSNTDPNIIYFIPNGGKALKSYNIDTRAVTTVHTFSCSDGTYVSYFDEGNQSLNDRYWAVVCMASGPTTVSVITYDKQTDAEIVAASLTDICGGTCGTSYSNKIDWVGMSPSGDYVVINWKIGNNFESNYTRGTGTEVFSRSLSYIGMLSAGNSHMDVGYDVNGIEVGVMRAIDAGHQMGNTNERTVYVRKLEDPTQTSYVTFPCTFSRSAPCDTGTVYGNSDHISMRVGSGSAMGWALWSTWNESSYTGNGKGWGSHELFAVKIDTTVANGSTWRRLGRAMSIRGSVYEAEPHAVMNRDFTKILWGSNWNTEGGQISPYMITLSGSLTVTLSPAGAVTAGAQWAVDGGNWQNSGTTVTGLSAGSHTITYKAATGYTSPESASATVVVGETATASGTYVLTTPAASFSGIGFGSGLVN